MNSIERVMRELDEISAPIPLEADLRIKAGRELASMQHEARVVRAKALKAMREREADEFIRRFFFQR